VEVQRRYSGGTAEVQRRYSGGTAEDGGRRFWWVETNKAKEASKVPFLKIGSGSGRW
jgi:hypothetical protein